MKVQRWKQILEQKPKTLIVQDLVDCWTDFTNFDNSIILKHHQHKFITLDQYIHKLNVLNVPGEWDIVLDFNNDPTHRVKMEKYFVRNIGTYDNRVYLIGVFKPKVKR